MKIKKFILVLAVGMICALGTSCAGEGPADGQESSASQTAGEETYGETCGETSPGTDQSDEKGDGQAVTDNQGKLRITYTGRRSSVRYITSADQLPDYEELAQFDDTYFAEHALLLVIETVNSGSVDTGILSVEVEDGLGTVTLYHDVPEGTVQTMDMATWLLWTEAEPGLTCRWSVANPALQSDTSAY